MNSNRDSDFYEVTTYRIDGKYDDGRHPDKVIFTFTNEDFKILSNSQVGCAIVYY